MKINFKDRYFYVVFFKDIKPQYRIKFLKNRFQVFGVSIALYFWVIRFGITKKWMRE